MSGAAGTDETASAALRRLFRTQLERTQWLPRPRLAAYQQQLLEPLLRHAARAVPFYRDGRLSPVLRPGGGLEMARWHEVPILTRQEARAAGAALHADAVPDVTGDWAEDSTSGSTGSPFVFRRSASASVASQGCYDRHLTWMGLTPETPCATIRVPREPQRGRTAGDDAAARPTPLVLDSSRLDIDPLDWLATTGARHLMTYPTLARDLANRLRSSPTPKVTLDTVITFGEVLTQDSRAAITAGFGARVFDRYAAQESGLLAGECEHGERHIQSEIHLVEIVDDAGRPMPPEAEGDVVLTSFYNYAMPLIRYHIGDRASLSDAVCRCCRTLPLLRGLSGRARDMFRFADGSRVWPYVPFVKLRQYVEMRQLQIAQTAMDRVEIRYVPEGTGAVQHEALTAFVRQSLRVDVEVDVVRMESIPRTAGGKYFDYICLLAP